MTKLTMKKYDPDLRKVTCFFTNWSEKDVFAQIIKSLKINDLKYRLPKKTWKLTYTKEMPLEKEAQEDDEDRA